MWKLWLLGVVVIGAAVALDLSEGVLNVYRAGLALACGVAAVVTWRRSRARTEGTE